MGYGEQGGSCLRTHGAVEYAWELECCGIGVLVTWEWVQYYSGWPRLLKLYSDYLILKALVPAEKSYGRCRHLLLE